MHTFNKITRIYSLRRCMCVGRRLKCSSYFPVESDWNSTNKSQVGGLQQVNLGFSLFKLSCIQLQQGYLEI